MAKSAQLLFCVAVLFQLGCSPSDGGGASAEISPWPLKVPTAQLSCDNGRVFLTTPDGTRYAVNGTARADAPIMDPVQLRYDHDLIQRGLELCQRKVSSIRLVPGQEEAPTDLAASSWTFERDEFNPNSLTLMIASANDIQGVRPRLIISCDESGALAGVKFGTMPPRISINEVARYKHDDSGDWRIVRVGGGGGDWFLRDESADEQAAEKRFVSEVLRSTNVFFSAPTGFNHDGEVRWDLSVLGDHKREIQDRCDGVPVSAPADSYFLRVANVVATPDDVAAEITTNMPLPIEISILLGLQGQAERDEWIGADGRAVVATSPARVTLPRRKTSGLPLGQPLPPGNYDFEAKFYPRWGAANGTAEAKKIKREVAGKSEIQLR